MAITDARYPSAAFDVVALLRKSDFQQVAEKARAMKASVKETSKAMEHPVEDGTAITDHRIIAPTEIELAVMLADEDYRQTYQELKALWRSAELLIVQTRTDTYPDMLIVEMPHDETPDMIGAVPIALRLKEVKTVKAQYGALPRRAVVRPQDSSTVKRGEVTPQPTNDSAAQAAVDALTSFGGKK